MVVNPNKFQLMFLGLKQMLRININGVKILAKKHVKLLGVEIDNKLKSDEHVEALCQKVNKKTSAFTRLNIYISREQTLSIFNVMILSNFNYCPLVWLLCNKSADKKIEHAHKPALRIFTMIMIHRSNRFYGAATAIPFTQKIYKS